MSADGIGALAEAPTVCTVASRRVETSDTVTLELLPPAGSLSEVAPGQFTMLYAFGAGEVPISVSGVTERGGLLHTVRGVGAITRALSAAREGEAVGVRGPFGTAWRLPADPASDVVVVAGGLGLAPLRRLIEAAVTQTPAFRRVVLLVGARSDGEVLFPGDLDRWGDAPHVEAMVTVDRAGPAWTGHVGVVTELFRAAEIDPDRTHAFVCGPEVMMRRAAGGLVEAGVAPARVQLSLERNMQCGTGHCGHCQLAPFLLCQDGPVVTWDRAAPVVAVREL